tara:strand:- start:23114 stop:23980 length:867 start_codon:yes stop_codon:yes gene_type:complete
MKTKGVILAGGKGSRLLPVTQSTSKQLLPVYDKPMIFYPLSTLMLAGIRDFLVVTTPLHQNNFKSLLGDGSSLGISIEYICQDRPRGLAEVFILAESYLMNCSVALILGDNLFYGNNLLNQIKINLNQSGLRLFAYSVKDPKEYGVVEFSDDGKPLTIEEKPIQPKSNYAITGLYIYDNTVLDKAKKLKLSHRDEYEITDLNNMFLQDNQVKIEILGRGIAWFDTGKIDSLYEATSYVKTIQNRQGFKICCPEEIAWRNGWISSEQIISLAEPLMPSGYGSYLKNLIQ